MKNTALFISIAALLIAAGAAVYVIDGKNSAKTETEAVEAVAQKGAVVWFNMDTIIQDYDMANDLKSVVETKVQSINNEVNKRGSRLEKDINAFQEKIDKGLMTRSTAEVQGQKLQQQEADFNNYAAQKQQEIQEEQVVMMNQLGDAIQTFLQKYNEEKQYSMILTNQGGAPVITADPALDITEDVLAGLNAEYIRNKDNKGKE